MQFIRPHLYLVLYHASALANPCATSPRSIFFVSFLSHSTAVGRKDCSRWYHDLWRVCYTRRGCRRASLGLIITNYLHIPWNIQ